MSIEDVYSDLETAGVLAVLVVDDAADAVPLAEALLAGGVNAMELTLRTEAAMDSLVAIRQSVPGMKVGIGTILTPVQVEQVAAAGAAFGVSPGINPEVVKAARNCGLPFAPGIATPTDIETALSLGCRRLKFFPAAPSGGLPYLRSIAAPYNHLGLKYIPLGGVSMQNIAEYLGDPLIAAVGGSWLAPRNVVAAKDWTAIEANAKEARQAVDAVRGQVAS
ncbi:MAG: bifunctional 4-hydroxy-2-oxoglutarate aldolase/2-dehydro-3-deoxy-phosphogluconate aldolase [Planctomycetales bacterium]|nr:bifunctional 4-hydroxy-2-oxoglutarate aldolase/2-dehydro-3-deoxy-phosphogluconate aldolase [Planctomycetales bacterium]